MLQRYPARTIRLTITVTSLGLVWLAGGGFATGANAAGRIAVGTTRPVTGKLQSSTKHALMVIQSGSKKLTPILLNAKTLYIVKGKRVAKPPIFTRGSLISVLTAVTKGSYTAQIVVVSAAPSPVQGTSTAPAAGSSTAASSPSISVKGAVTLTSAASVTLKTSAGTQTIKLTASTHYVVAGKPSSLKPILHAGEEVEIMAVPTHGVLVGQVFTVV
jgi:hypothetical protein